MSAPVTPDQIIESARTACDVYFRGEFATKKSIRFCMEDLRALVRDYDARQETATITRPSREHA